MKKKKEIKYLKAQIKSINQEWEESIILNKRVESEIKKLADRLCKSEDSYQILKNECSALVIENTRLNNIISKHGSLIQDNYEDVEVGQYYIRLTDSEDFIKDAVHLVTRKVVDGIQLDEDRFLAFIPRKDFKRVTITEE